MQVRFKSSPLLRYPFLACTGDYLKARFSTLSSFDSPRRRFRTIRTMEPQTSLGPPTPTATTSVSHLRNSWKDSLAFDITL